VSAVADAEDILHETRTRLRLRVPAGVVDLKAFESRIGAVQGVSSVRTNPAAACAVVHHDGRPQTRAAVLARVHAPAATIPWRPGGRRREVAPGPASIVPPVLAAALPVIPAAWRSSAALAVIALRVLAQSDRLRSDAAGVLLDAASLSSLAVSRQELAVAASVVLRDVSERLSLRFIRQADELLDQLVPAEADRYQVLREREDTSEWSWWPLRGIRSGDRVRLFSGDVIPVDGCVVDGRATLTAPASPATQRDVRPGDHVASGERLRDGTVEVRAEADAASSRLERLRNHLQHAVHGRDPIGRLTPGLERVLTFPLTAGALVLGLTGDTARAASMLQADPHKGLDLALPLAREAALYALARQGLLASGLETIERLGVARTLVLQDAGVLATGRWTIESIRMEDGGHPQRLRESIAALADTPIEVLETASFPDLMVRQWIRHGAVLHTDAGDLHLASPARLRRTWGVKAAGLPTARAGEPLRRVLFAVRDARIVARVVLASPLRPGVIDHLHRLAELGFSRITVFAEGDGTEHQDAPEAVAVAALAGALVFPDDRGLRSDWLAEVTSDGMPVVMVHTVLRDLLPPGSLSLTPTDADAGAHGVLLGDPMASLVAARTIAQRVHRRLVVQQGAASTVNAVLMMGSALQWVPPIGTALINNGFALLLLLDSLRLEAMGRPLAQQRAGMTGEQAPTLEPSGSISMSEAV